MPERGTRFHHEHPITSAEQRRVPWRFQCEAHPHDVQPDCKGHHAAHLQAQVCHRWLQRHLVGKPQCSAQAPQVVPGALIVGCLQDHCSGVQHLTLEHLLGIPPTWNRHCYQEIVAANMASLEMSQSPPNISGNLLCGKGLKLTVLPSVRQP